MKKILIIALSILTLCSCSKKPFSLDEQYYNNTQGYVEVETLDEIAQMVDEERSFALFVYMPGCTSCAAFKPIVESFMEQNEMSFYSISSAVIGQDKDNSIMKAIEYAPSVLLYNKGKVVASLDAMSDDDTKYYKSIQGFTEWFMQHCEIKIS